MFFVSRAFIPVGVVNLHVLRKWTHCILNALLFLHTQAAAVPLIHGHLQYDFIHSVHKGVTISCLFGIMAW